MKLTKVQQAVLEAISCPGGCIIRTVTVDFDTGFSVWANGKDVPQCTTQTLKSLWGRHLVALVSELIPGGSGRWDITDMGRRMLFEGGN